MRSDVLNKTITPSKEKYGAVTAPGYANSVAFDKKTFLKGQAEFLETQLQAVKNRLFGLNEEAE